jgi:hypothetical protein
MGESTKIERFIEAVVKDISDSTHIRPYNYLDPNCDRWCFEYPFYLKTTVGFIEPLKEYIENKYGVDDTEVLTEISCKYLEFINKRMDEHKIANGVKTRTDNRCHSDNHVG